VSGPPRIQFHEITKRYPGILALDRVSFDVAPGCVHAIVGENGAGKSTLMKVLSGATQADSGSIAIDGVQVKIARARDAERLGIATVYQELSLAPHLSVAENVFLGRWPATAGVVRFSRLRAEAARLFARLGLTLPASSNVESLSVAQQQMVEIARAVSLGARVLVLDEPSAVLTTHELASLFRLVREMRGRGVSILYISHRLDEVFELADFVTVLRDGAHISTRPIGEVTRERLITEAVGRGLSEDAPQCRQKRGEPVLRVRGMAAPGRCADVSFEIHTGEVFGLTGMVGSGRSSVARAIFGTVPGVQGTVQVGDRCGPFRSPRQAQRADIAFVPEDRKREGLLLQRAVRENLTLAHRNSSARWGVLALGAERRFARGLLDRFGIRARGTEQAVTTLSGGNQQKTLLARWLQRPYRVIILDEPTRGVDVGAKAEIYRLIGELAERGAAILVVSSELPEVIRLCDRIGVMCRGRLASVLDNSTRATTQEQLLSLAVGAGAA